MKLSLQGTNCKPFEKHPDFHFRSTVTHDIQIQAMVFAVVQVMWCLSPVQTQVEMCIILVHWCLSSYGEGHLRRLTNALHTFYTSDVVLMIEVFFIWISCL